MTRAIPNRADCRVTTQLSRGVRQARWAYVLHIPGYWPQDSPAHWGTPEKAEAAGEDDLAAVLAFYAEDPGEYLWGKSDEEVSDVLDAARSPR